MTANERAELLRRASLDNTIASGAMEDEVRAIALSDEALARTGHPILSEAEQQRRREAIRHARASVELEGFTQSPESLRQIERFIHGEIDIETFTTPPFGDAHER